MDVTWPLVLTAAAVFVSMVIMVVVCLRCRNKGPLVSIRQATGSEESSDFRVIHPTQPIIDRNSIHPSSNLLLPSADHRHMSFTPTETDSNPSYENPADGPGYADEDSDIEDPGYIIVLPEGEGPLTNQSRASTPSSDVLHDYENVPDQKEDREYLNVDPQQSHESTPELSAQSDSDDDEGNYVNVHDGTLTE